MSDKIQLILSNEGVFPITRDRDGKTLPDMPATGLNIPGTIQGEGKLAGISALFIRFASCNLRCIWQLPNGKLSICDTSYASFNSLKNRPTDVREVADLVVNNLGSIKHVVITGGEPFIQKAALANLCELLKKETGVHITVETNGTLFDAEAAKNIDLFSISPKLVNSNPNFHKLEQLGLEPSGPLIFHAEKRINLKALQSFLDLSNELSKDLQLKFVVGKLEEVEEIENGYLKQLQGWKPEDILLMPLGANREELVQTSRMVMQMAIQNGWRYAPRIHIEIFGSKAGV
jgi:7-carboxy-7-deazaguanine synthase